MSNFYAALEIGTTRTVLAIGETESGGRLKVTCHAEIPSTGVRKSQILDMKQATQSIRSVLREIEKKQEECGSKISFGNAFLCVSGMHIKADSYSGSVHIGGSKVSDDEIDAVSTAARQLPLSNDREPLDIIEQDYVIDNRGGIKAPKGMAGRLLSLNTLHIHADHNRIQDARTAAEGAHLDIRDPLFATTCAAEAVLEDYERNNGALVLDVGGGSTGYAAYSDGHLITCGVIGVGGDHITNDIAHAFQTTNAQAEALKINEASAMIGAYSNENSRVKITGSSTLMENRTISRRALDTVVHARLRELFSIIRETLEEHDLLHRLHAGVILTGGGARMRDIETLVEQSLGTTARIGRPIHVDGLEDTDFPAGFAAIAGALLFAHRNYEETSILDGIFGRFFKK